MPRPGPIPRKRKPAATLPTVLAPIVAKTKTTKAGRTVRPRTPAPAPAAAAKPSGYDWGGGSAGHSISLAAHKQHVSDAAANKNPLYDPTQQLSGADLKNAAGDLVNLEYGPQRAALARELSNVTTQGGALAQRAGDYSAQLARTDAALPGKVGAIGDTLLQKLAANTAGASSAIQGSLTDVKDRAAADATLRGIDPSIVTGGTAAETQQQQDRLAALDKSSTDAAAAQTANYQGLATLAGQARSQMGTEVQGELLNRLANNQADVRARQADESTQEGAAASKATTDLRQQAFENLITQQGLNIKSADIKAQTSLGQARIDETAKSRRQRARDAAANRKLKRETDAAAARGKANAVNEFGISNGDWLNMTNKQRQDAIINFKAREHAATTTPAAAKPESATAVAKKGRINSILTDIGTDPKLVRHRYEVGPRLVQILVKRGADPLEAQAAAEIARHGAITPQTQAQLEQAGIKIPSKWKGTKPTGRDKQPG